MSEPNATGTTTAGSSVEGRLTFVPPPKPERQGMRDLFDVIVYAANELRLVPKCELARSLLAMWQQGWADARVTSTHDGLMGATDKMRYGKTLRQMDVEFKTRPMLSSGDDPYFTGMVLTPEEQSAAREAVDAMREKRHRVEVKARKQLRAQSKQGSK